MLKKTDDLFKDMKLRDRDRIYDIKNTAQNLNDKNIMRKAYDYAMYKNAQNSREFAAYFEYAINAYKKERANRMANYNNYVKKLENEASNNKSQLSPKE
jgi:hypothetical protein